MQTFLDFQSAFTFFFSLSHTIFLLVYFDSRKIIFIIAAWNSQMHAFDCVDCSLHNHFHVWAHTKWVVNLNIKHELLLSMALKPPHKHIYTTWSRRKCGETISTFSSFWLIIFVCNHNEFDKLTSVRFNTYIYTRFVLFCFVSRHFVISIEMHTLVTICFTLQLSELQDFCYDFTYIISAFHLCIKFFCLHHEKWFTFWQMNVCRNGNSFEVFIVWSVS